MGSARRRTWGPNVCSVYRDISGRGPHAVRAGTRIGRIGSAWCVFRMIFKWFIKGVVI